MPIVALIGPDGAGKSTIVSVLKEEKVNCDFYKGTHEKSGEIADVFVKAISTARPDRILLCDRLHYPDDIVYGRAVRKAPSILEYVRSLCEFTLRSYDTVLVFVTANEVTLRKRLSKRGDGYVDSSVLSAVLHEYHKFLATTTLPWYGINTTVLDSLAAAHQVKGIMYNHWPEIYMEGFKRV